jgi:hypothetical protein
MLQIAKTFKSNLENAKNAFEYQAAFTKLLSELNETEIEYDGVDLDVYLDTISDLYSTTPIPTVEETKESKSGTKTITTKPIFKRPQAGARMIGEFTDRLHQIKQLQNNKLVHQAMVNKLSNQPEANRAKVGTALKAILFNSKLNNTYSNITKILNWINQVKNFNVNTNNKVLLYMSNQVDGESKGGNGKSCVINSLREALNEMEIPNCSRTLPTWYDSEITSEFANNVVSFASEQSFCLPHSTYDIMDKSNYQTRIKYQPSTVMKSICNIVGTTNESLVRADQTLRRRLSIIYCNENQVIEEFSEEQFKQLPTEFQQIKAWKYLLTHDLTNAYPTSKDSETSISNEEREILWSLVDWQEEWKDVYDSSKELAVRTFKDVCDRTNKKISFASAIPVAKKYGAVIVKKGTHSRETEGSAMIDLSNMNIPLEIFDDSKSFTLPDVFKLIEAEYGEDYDPTTDKPSNDETDTDANSTTSTNEEGTGSAETNSKEISLKEAAGNDISPLALDLLDLIEEPEIEIPDTPQEPTKYDTIEESNHSYERAEIVFASDQPEDQFEVLNPVNTYKRDDCVLSRRNFIFEMDDTPLEEQKKYLKDLIDKKIVNRWVFSGNKSIHMRITVNRDVNDTQEYKYIWKKLNAEYFDGKADRACANPARLTRRLNGIRVNFDEHNQKKIGKKQIGQNIGNFTIEILPIKEEYKGWKRNKEIINELIHLMDNRRPRKYDTLEETVEHWKDSDVKTAVLDCIAGNGDYYQGIQALSAAKFAGFTYDEVCKEINFGSWNFREDFFNQLEC